MMEDFGNIADETFPSFLGHSLSTNASVTFENVTISSNPGLPVAASTVARSKMVCDNRLSDICASYLEEKLSPQLGSSHRSQSDPEQMRRFALSFHDDMEAAKQVKEPQLASVSLKESHSICGEQDQNVVEHSNEDTLIEVLPLEQLEDLSTRICFLPDSKTDKVGPPEPSENLIDDEISSDCLSNSLASFLENEKLSSLASSEEDFTDDDDDDIDDEEFFDNQLEAYFDQLIKPEVTRGDTDIQKLSDCCTALKLSKNGLCQENFQVPETYKAVTGVDSGNASDEESQNQGITGHPVQKEVLPRAVPPLNSMATGDVLNSCTATELQLNSILHQCMDNPKADVLDVLPKQEIQSSRCQAAASDAEVLPTARGFSGHYTTPEVPRANAPQTDATEGEVGLADTYLSPTADTCDNISLATTDRGDLSHSVVYQNEEGKWVTDLAYYTSFDEEQDLNLPQDDQTNEEFITGSDAAAMIARDQKEFEEAHKLLQLGKVDILNASELADTSWKSPNSCVLLRTSGLDKDESYLHLSLGEFFGQRSEALGCLGGGNDVKRPSFGYYITSPKKRQPVALIQPSVSSGGDTIQEISQLSEVFPGDLDAQIEEDADSTLCEGTWHNMDNTAGKHKSINIENGVNIEDATKSQAKDGVHKDKLGDSLSNPSDSVLSISTIASAIANASSSANASQLAAMMMALSNKTKRTCLVPGIVKETELSANQILSSNMENSAFDMEKYLKKSDEIAHESEYESTVNHEASVQNLIPDTHQTSTLTSRCCIRENTEIVDQATNAFPEPCNDLVERSTGNTLSLRNLKPAKQSSKYASVSPTKVKPTQKLNNDLEKQNAKTEKKTKDASTGNTKHGTLEKLSPTSQSSTAEHKPIQPECDLQPLEDEQYSFRPSTSPLIHSSPSETSGTTHSGSETDFTCTSLHQEPSCKESVLSQSVYSSPSMSRLTYVSASDVTLKNTTVKHNLETYWNEDDSELSTTIIRSSPTPAQEHANENVEDHSCQRNRKAALLSIDKKSEENKLAEVKRKLDNVLVQEVSKEGFPKNERQLPSIPSNVAANPKELDDVKSALPTKFCTFQQLSVNVDAQEAQQDQTSKAQRQGLPSLNVLPIYPGSSTCMPFNQSSSGEQYVPISSFKSHVTTPESQAISSSLPTLLTGCSLATTPFAQQHLGNAPSTGNTVLSQFHGCSSAGFGLPAGNPLMSGIPLGPNIGPGSLSAASFCNPSWNKDILNIKSCTVQPLGADRNEWELPKSPGIGHVKVPEELKFPNASCVGIASQTVLSIFNPTERWLQVSIGILSVSVNGEKVDPVKYRCLVFKNKAIIGPYSTNDLKILFLPCHSGIFQCILNVSSWPVSADAETIVQAEALASRVVLTAVAENPHLEVETGKRDYLDFGDLNSGSWKALPLKLINKTHAFVPIRLIINANAVAWRCFTFSKEPVNPPSEQSLHMDAVSQTAAPSVVNHVIHASYDGQDPEALTVWVLFHAPKKQITSDSLGPADEYLARVDVEVDSPGPSSVIKSIPLRARAGTARIHAPKDLQTIYMSTSVGSTAKQQLPLKNAGNIGVHLKIKTSNQDRYFTVEPEDLFLLPGEEQEVTVLFFPKNITTTESTLKILVLPSGPQYEVVIKGVVESEENRPVSTAAAWSAIPPILSNKQFIAWGGIPLGASVQQKLTLRNDSPTVTQHLRLLIRGQDRDCFQLQSIFGSEERLTSSWELKIRPKEDTNIYLIFAPTRITCFFAKLEIKQLGIRSQPGIKFTIPLSGYGGTSNITLENVIKLSHSYLAVVDGLLPAGLGKASFCVRNTGSRAAYVKAVCYANVQTKTVMDPRVMMLSPEKFVLREGTQQVIIVTWDPIEKEKNFQNVNALSSTVCFFYGDEVVRQQYCRAMRCKPEVEKHIIPENCLVSSVIFDEEFQGEQLVTEVCDIPRGTNDIHLFYANMRKVILSVIGYPSFDQDGFQQLLEHHLESNRFENSIGHLNSTLDVLPVKGPQGPPLPVKTDDMVQNKSVVEQTWAVKPEYLTLTAPSISGIADTGQVQIVNSCNRTLAFELSWPAHCLTITPQHGVVEPERSTLILVSPNPSLATKPSLIPWSGLICILCDNGQKFIKVQIQEAVAQDVPEANFPSRIRDVLTPQLENPAVHVAKPDTVLPPTKMEIKNRTIVFPKTRPGQSSESYLEIENKGDENVKWFLSSFAPPYVKDVHETEGVYRVTYSAFRCSRVSGVLEAHKEDKVAIIFLPRDKGDYSQFWDLECHPVEKHSWKHKLRFQLSGTGIKAENEALVSAPRSPRPVIPEMKVDSEVYGKKIGKLKLTRGVFAPEDLYIFPPTRVGESSMIKVNLQNNSFTTYLVKFINPQEPFYIRHSKYFLRGHHYINVPVHFKPKEEGMFESVFIVLTTKYGSVNIRLRGKGVAKK